MSWDVGCKPMSENELFCQKRMKIETFQSFKIEKSIENLMGKKRIDLFKKIQMNINEIAEE